METTRHFVATVYAVNDGAVALHEHDRLGMWLPPGGHVNRDELPHEAARRETREEIGTTPTLVSAPGDVASPTVRELPQPQYLLLEDINVHENGAVGHQHVDFVFFGTVETRKIDPADGEAPADDWEWFGATDLRERADELEDDVVAVGQEAIDAVADRP